MGTEWRFYISPLAPDIAVEILLPGDRPALLEEKISIYIANGSLAVVVVDPIAKAVRVWRSS